MDERIEEILSDHLALSNLVMELASPPATDGQVIDSLRDYLCVMKRLREMEQGPWPNNEERKVICQHLDMSADILKSKCEELGLAPLELAGFGLEMPSDNDGDQGDDGGSGILAPLITGPRDRPMKDARSFEEVHEEGEDERR